MLLKMKRVNPPIYNQYYINTGDGPTVILLHGLFGNLNMWLPLVNTLKKEHRVIIPRLPIFDLPVEHTNIKYLVQVLHEFIEWNKLTNVTLVGHAIGGQVALWYAHLYGSNVRKIVLSGSAGLFENSPFISEEYNPERDYNYVHEKVKDAFYQADLVPDQLIEEIYQAVQSIPKRLTLGTLARSSKSLSVSPILARLIQPVLLIWGLQDKITPPEVALHFHDLLFNAEVKFIDNCGHLPMVEHPEKFTEYVLQFLNRVEPVKSNLKSTSSDD